MMSADNPAHNRDDHQLFFTHPPDNTQWFLKQRGDNPTAVPGYSIWQGQQYGLSCDKNLHGDVNADGRADIYSSSLLR